MAHTENIALVDVKVYRREWHQNLIVQSMVSGIVLRMTDATDWGSAPDELVIFTLPSGMVSEQV